MRYPTFDIGILSEYNSVDQPVKVGSALAFLEQQGLQGTRKRTMSNLKRWRRLGQGQFHKWEQPGERFEGTWRGAHDGRFGPLGTLETMGRVITFPLLTALRDRLHLVRE